MTIAISTSLRFSFADAVARTRDALAGRGYGILTEIDTEDYLILGSCNPPLAHRAVTVNRSWCAAIRPTAAGILVEAMNPQLLVNMSGQTGLQHVGTRSLCREIPRSVDPIHDTRLRPAKYPGSASGGRPAAQLTTD